MIFFYVKFLIFVIDFIFRIFFSEFYDVRVFWLWINRLYEEVNFIFRVFEYIFLILNIFENKIDEKNLYFFVINLFLCN